MTASYAVDHHDRIVWTDEGFAALAESHGQPGLPHDAVGRPLTAYVAGGKPKALQQALIAKARGTGREPLELRYRCDAPTMRRFAVLKLDARPDGTLVFTTWFESTEERAYQALLDVAVPRARQTVTLCAWCNRFGTGGAWHEAEDVPMTDAGLPTLEHSVCEICELLLTGSGPATRPGAGPRQSGPYGRP